MNNKIIKIFVKNNEQSSENLIFEYLEKNKVIYIQNKSNHLKQSLNFINYDEPGIILNSSGSKNIPKRCLHHLTNLDKSAIASGNWLEDQGFDLKDFFIFNTLPFYHISGLMPLWRKKIWGCDYINISPKLIKRSKDLLDKTHIIIKNQKKNLITSLVPTQLFRLLSDEYGIKWLKLFDLIWVGGAPIPDDIKDKCIKEKLNISPCYGSTETAAMIATLKPCEFLNGNSSSGEILKDISLRINQEGLIEVKTNRIGIKVENNSKLVPFNNKNGWWESGDLGKIIQENNNHYLNIFGRIDNVLHSGGEIVFLDSIKKRLENFILFKNLPIKQIHLKSIKDNLWGNRFLIVILFRKNIEYKNVFESLEILKRFIKDFPKHERPVNVIINDGQAWENHKEINNWKNIH